MVSGHLFFVKFYWYTATVIYLLIVYGCFAAITAKLSGLDRNPMVHKAYNMYYLALYREVGQSINYV